MWIGRNASTLEEFVASIFRVTIQKVILFMITAVKGKFVPVLN
jgi:hypothetical protein